MNAPAKSHTFYDPPPRCCHQRQERAKTMPREEKLKLKQEKEEEEEEEEREEKDKPMARR